MKQISEKQLLVITAFCSILLSLWLSASSDIISRDSTLYLKVAQAFLDAGFVEAFKTWSWPFYPVFFALIHQLTGLSLEHSAYALNAILNAVVCVAFVKIYSKIAFNGHRLWVAALFIITFVGFNDYRGDIIRGYGFWAFTLLAVYFYLSFYQTRQKAEAFKWQMSIFIATLFRPEAIVFAFAAPLYFLFIPSVPFKQRLSSYAWLSSFILLIVLSVLVVFLVSAEFRELILNHRPIQADYLSPTFLLGSFNQGVDNFIKYVLVWDYSAKYAALMLASGLLTMLVYKVLLNLGLVYAGIWGAGIYHKWLRLKKESWIVLYFALIAFAILMVLNFSRFYVSSRYIVLLVILLGLIVAQYLDVLLFRLSQNRKKWLLAAVSVYIAVQFLDSIISIGASKAPIKDIAQWTVQNIGTNEKIACNESRLGYYSNYHCTDITSISDFYTPEKITQLKQQGFRYLLLWVKHNNKDMHKALADKKQFKLLKKFANKKDDLGALYLIKQGKAK